MDMAYTHIKEFMEKIYNDILWDINQTDRFQSLMQIPAEVFWAIVTMDFGPLLMASILF